MKYIGFVKEHDSFSFAISFRDTFGDIPNSEAKIICILNHLKEGVLFLGWMGYAVDIEDKNLIAPDAYYTDGIWAWPIYFPYYIEKYNNIIIEAAEKRQKSHQFTFFYFFKILKIRCL